MTFVVVLESGDIFLLSIDIVCRLLQLQHLIGQGVEGCRELVQGRVRQRFVVHLRQDLLGLPQHFHLHIQL